MTIPVARQSSSVAGLGRIDCYPEAETKYSNFSKEACLARHCLFDDTVNLSGIPCYFQPNYGYLLQGNEEQIENGKRLRLKRNQAVTSPFPEPIENVILDVQYYTDDIIRFKLYDADHQRYEVPIPLKASTGQTISAQYEFTYLSNSSNDNILSFAIKRRINQTTLFDTSIGGLVLNNQFLQIVSRLQSPHVYGFGENNHLTLKHNVSTRQIWGIFGRDQATTWNTNANHYGTHPFYLVMEQIPNSNETPSGQMHGVLLLNSNAMDYSFGPDPSVTIRTIGGILDFFVFLGPAPEQVIHQYTWLVGRPVMPPYWSLGFHLCRWGYGNLTHMQTVNQRNRDAGVPIDVQYADIDYMDANKIFTIDPINYHDPFTIDDQKYYTPTIEGIKQDVFIKWEDGSLMKGACWPGEVFSPDFFTNRTHIWWAQMIRDFRRVNLTFDGVWLDMNEPAMFGTNEDAPWNWNITRSNYTLKCPRSTWDDPPYRTKAAFRYDESVNRTSRLSDRTLCMSAIQGEIDSKTGKAMYRHYDVHSLYGWSQTKPTLDIIRSLTGQRSLLLPRSTFVGSGQWSAHWLGDNAALWSEMKLSLIGLVEFNWFGIPMVGADICGFDQIPTQEMCIRWQQIGAFYPLARNHNIWKLPDQDPGAWEPSATAIMVSALRIRYTLLPHYYTLFYKAHTQGSTVIRPLFHEYPTDKITLDIYLQFLVGSHIMIAPVTDDGAREVQVYIPASKWYDYYTGVPVTVQAQYTTLQAPLTTIPILLRGGIIIPTQLYANNTKYSRMNPFNLIIVLDSNGNAEGDLFYDDGETIETIETNGYFYAIYKWSSQCRQLKIEIIKNNYAQMSNLILNSLTFYGLREVSSNITVNGKQMPVIQRSQTQIMEVIELGLSMSKNYTLMWLQQNETWSSNDQNNAACNWKSTYTTSPTSISPRSESPYTTYSKNTFFCFFILFLYNLLH
ncbi:unnamed protein product [Adineta steineri]|uniref:P-type domain-containing protein n=2 Tax=Adineta steineri TaxID=433720 RepID=A0A818RZ41_9BILA|nr:unnamed protein product [Adineta steineri]